MYTMFVHSIPKVYNIIVYQMLTILFFASQSIGCALAYVLCYHEPHNVKQKSS
jgi:hypothetical protein